VAFFKEDSDFSEADLVKGLLIVAERENILCWSCGQRSIALLDAAALKKGKPVQGFLQSTIDKVVRESRGTESREPEVPTEPISPNEIYLQEVLKKEHRHTEQDTHHYLVHSGDYTESLV
jgi:hypothetical protein